MRQGCGLGNVQVLWGVWDGVPRKQRAGIASLFFVRKADCRILGFIYGMGWK